MSSTNASSSRRHRRPEEDFNAAALRLENTILRILLHSSNKSPLQLSTMKIFFIRVVEIAVTNEEQERMLNDADEKYFHVDTSVQCWLGVKFDIAQSLF